MQLHNTSRSVLSKHHFIPSFFFKNAFVHSNEGGLLMAIPYNDRCHLVELGKTYFESNKDITLENYAEVIQSASNKMKPFNNNRANYQETNNICLLIVDPIVISMADCVNVKNTNIFIYSDDLQSAIIGMVDDMANILMVPTPFIQPKYKTLKVNSLAVALERLGI